MVRSFKRRGNSTNELNGNYRLKKKNYMKSKLCLINSIAYYTTEESMDMNHREKIRIKTNEQKLNYMWNKTEPSNIHVIKIPERKER